MTMTELTRIVVCASCGCINHHLGKWRGGTWSELNRTKVYSISKKLNSAKVGNPLYLNSSHVVRAKHLHCANCRKGTPTLVLYLQKYLFLEPGFCIFEISMKFLTFLYRHMCGCKVDFGKIRSVARRIPVSL